MINLENSKRSSDRVQYKAMYGLQSNRMEILHQAAFFTTLSSLLMRVFHISIISHVTSIQSLIFHTSAALSHLLSFSLPSYTTPVQYTVSSINVSDVAYYYQFVSVQYYSPFHNNKGIMVFQNCTGQCEEYQDCVQCLAFGMGPIPSQECEGECTDMLTLQTVPSIGGKFIHY